VIRDLLGECRFVAVAALALVLGVLALELAGLLLLAGR
jgi:hypothetical protein